MLHTTFKFKQNWTKYKKKTRLLLFSANWVDNFTLDDLWLTAIGYNKLEGPCGLRVWNSFYDSIFLSQVMVGRLLQSGQFRCASVNFVTFLRKQPYDHKPGFRVFSSSSLEIMLLKTWPIMSKIWNNHKAIPSYPSSLVNCT